MSSRTPLAPARWSRPSISPRVESRSRPEVHPSRLTNSGRSGQALAEIGPTALLSGSRARSTTATALTAAHDRAPLNEHGAGRRAARHQTEHRLGPAAVSADSRGHAERNGRTSGGVLRTSTPAQPSRSPLGAAILTRQTCRPDPGSARQEAFNARRSPSAASARRTRPRQTRRPARHEAASESARGGE